MKRIFVVNPNAGKGQTIKIIKTIIQICDSENVNYEVYFTKYRGDATQFVKNRAKQESCNIIYSVGGDGTLNEVINGIVDSNALLSIIPAGTGNDFYKCIDKDTKKIDLGIVNDRYFINIASIGADANVANNANIVKDKYSFIPNKLLLLLPLCKPV